MIVAITGSREDSDALKRCVFRTLDAVHAETPITLVLSGACVNKKTGEMSGADRYAIEWALANEIDFNGRPARWVKDGHPMAGPIRNRRVLDELAQQGNFRGERKRVVAAPGGRGTANMVMQAQARGFCVQEVAL